MALCYKVLRAHYRAFGEHKTTRTKTVYGEKDMKTALEQYDPEIYELARQEAARQSGSIRFRYRTH